MHVITLCWFEHTIVRNNFELFSSSVQFSFSPSHHKWWIFHITVDLWKYVIKMETKNSIKYFSLDFQYYVLSAFHFLSLWAGRILLDPPPLFFWRIKKQKFSFMFLIIYTVYCLSTPKHMNYNKNHVPFPRKLMTDLSVFWNKVYVHCGIFFVQWLVSYSFFFFFPLEDLMKTGIK